MTRLRAPAMAVGAVALVVAMLAGLARMGWYLPGLSGAVIARHGPLMVSGFLGTLIGLERAVGLGRPWAYASPILGALGAVAILADVPAIVSPVLFSAAAAVLVAIFAAIYRIRPDRPHVVLMLGAASWLTGNLVWVAGSAGWLSPGLLIPRLVPWWAGYLILTISGERLELAHLRPKAALSDTFFLVSVALLLAGLAISLASLPTGAAVAGAGMVGLGLWLVRFDIARRTVRQRGLTRYIAWCLLPGYFWLVLSGILWIVWRGQFGAGVYYDAMLHTVFLGFVMSMIFGHAPIILPAVLGVSVPYIRQFYVHLVLLHASLVLRIAGDLTLSLAARKWGGMLNFVAVLLFLASTIAAVRQGRRTAVSAAKVYPRPPSTRTASW